MPVPLPAGAPRQGHPLVPLVCCPINELLVRPVISAKPAQRARAGIQSMIFLDSRPRFRGDGLRGNNDIWNLRRVFM